MHAPWYHQHFRLSRDVSSGLSDRIEENKRLHPYLMLINRFQSGERLIVDCIDLPPCAAFYRDSLLAIGTFNVDQIVKQADTVMVG